MIPIPEPMMIASKIALIAMNQPRWRLKMGGGATAGIGGGACGSGGGCTCGGIPALLIGPGAIAGYGCDHCGGTTVGMPPVFAGGSGVGEFVGGVWIMVCWFVIAGHTPLIDLYCGGELM